MNRQVHSMETILTYDQDNKDAESDLSVIWSTAHVPGMDNAHGPGSRRVSGRRRLRYASLALGLLLTMHCRVASSAFTGGFFVFILGLLVVVVLLGNPMRHFEVYVGQWSISGPGRAFRIIPMLDGLGLAICINAIIRAICCCCMAAITALFVVASVSDRKLPFTYCRDFDLTPYDPLQTEIPLRSYRRFPFINEIEPEYKLFKPPKLSTVEKTTTFSTLGTYSRPKMNYSISFKPTDAVPLKSNNKYQTVLDTEADKEDDDRNDTVTHLTFPTFRFDESRWWKNVSFRMKRKIAERDIVRRTSTRSTRNFAMCRQMYNDKSYPPLRGSPAYNYFFVELMHYREDTSFFENFNLSLAISTIIIWLIMWIFMLYEKLSFGRLVWNNISPWILLVPVLWSASVVAMAVSHVLSMYEIFRRDFRITTDEVLSGLSDAMQISLFIHSASTGTEIIHGKGLNHFASGHIDPYLNTENMWHSAVLYVLAIINTAGAAACTLVDYAHPLYNSTNHIQESTMWIMPMFSKCTLSGDYSHLKSTVIFSGLTFSYMVVAYSLLKTALHTIFEYRVKLVFLEQGVVAVLILACMGLSLVVSTNGGIALLESVDALMAGIAMPFVCLLELVALLYVYRSRDFLSDMNAAAEDTTCSTRLTYQWQSLPFITMACLLTKLSVIHNTELPSLYMYIAIAPLLAVVVAVPLRAAHNALDFMKHRRRHTS